MSELELAAVGRQFLIFCAEREQLLRKCQELQSQLEKFAANVKEAASQAQP
jgi:hypothetical protein